VSWLRSESPAIAQPSQDPDGSDAELVAQARHGDLRAFANLYHRYLNQVYDYCRHRLASREAAEDATQTIFLKALASIQTCRDGSLFAGWLFAIARNVVVDSYRSSRGDQVTLDDESPLVDPAISPEDTAIGEEWRRELDRLRTDCLKRDDQEMLDLRLRGLSDREIAAAMQRSHGAIRIAQHRMVRRLRDCLGLNREASHAGL
jgi:RNA polymerase sigma-70 factor (ECF subfamily)